MDTQKLIKGMTIETARRYIEARKKINCRVDTIYALGKITSTLLEVPSDHIKLDPHAIGHIGKLISQEIYQIISCLDEEFVHVTDTNWELAELEGLEKE